MLMATQRSDTHEGQYAPPPSIEERYSVSINTARLGSHTAASSIDGLMREVLDAGGPALVLTASGMASHVSKEKPYRYVDQPSIRFGWDLARLQSEWHSVEKPVKQYPKSIRQWIEALPLKEVESNGKVSYIRDKDGAKEAHEAERQRLDADFSQELKFLAQKLPTRYRVREHLYAVAIHWRWPEPEPMTAEVLQHWLDGLCGSCNGTGEVMVNETVQTCTNCQGHKTTPVPYEWEGRRMRALMEDSKNLWLGSVRRQLGAMRGKR